MSTCCPICNSLDRADIENAILNMTSSTSRRSIEDIAKEFDVDVDALKLHAMFHTPLSNECELEGSVEQYNSLTKSMRLRETDMLNEVAQEYLITLKNMGRRINRLVGVADSIAEDDDQAFRMSKLLTKPAVDLYIGLGGEIRQTVKTISDIERAINGPQDNGSTGLVALANAIRGSESVG